MWRILHDILQHPSASVLYLTNIFLLIYYYYYYFGIVVEALTRTVMLLKFISSVKVKCLSP